MNVPYFAWNRVYANTLEERLSDVPRIDRISVRAKSPDRFLKKAATLEKSERKYTEPLEQIQDQLGARVVVFYESDIQRVNANVKKFFAAIENLKLVPETEAEFGYFGHHLVLQLPSDVVDRDIDLALVPQFFELQIKTLFQHAWSEAAHDLAYKPKSNDLTPDQKRKIAFTSAQAWGADLIFDQLFQEHVEASINSTE